MTKHEEYFYRTLYVVILISPNGGHQMNSYSSEDKARIDEDELIKTLSEADHSGYKVYLSYLDYSTRLNRIMSDDLITDDSELLFEN